MKIPVHVTWPFHECPYADRIVDGDGAGIPTVGVCEIRPSFFYGFMRYLIV